MRPVGVSSATLLPHVYGEPLLSLAEPTSAAGKTPSLAESSNTMIGTCILLITVTSAMPESNPAKQRPLTADQQAAIHEIETLGGTVFHVRGTSQQVVESISFRGPRFTDDALRLLKPFHGYDLYAFDLNGARVSEAGACRAILQFPELKSFAAMDVALGDAILEPLGKADKLVDVALRGTNVTSDGMKRLSQLKALEMLDLTDSPIDDSGLIHLEGLSKLKWLALGNTKTTSAGLESISKLENLETLLINDTQIDDQGLARLAPLKKLHSLRLDGTKITNAGLAHLKGLSKLKYFCFDNTAISDEGLKHIQNLPKLDDVSMLGSKVSRRGGTRFLLYLPANEKRFRKQREQFERGDWPPDESQ